MWGEIWGHVTDDLLELHPLGIPHLAVVVVGGADRGGVLLELAFGGATFAASDLHVGADGGTRFDVTPAAPVSMRPPLSGSTLTEEDVANSVNAKAFSCCGANAHITSVYLPGSAPDSSADTSCVPCANFDAATCRGRAPRTIR